MDHIKDAFAKVKQDILELNSEINFLKYEVIDLNKCLFDIRDILSEIRANTSKTPRVLSATDQHITSTDDQHTSLTSTDQSPHKPLKEQIIPFSTGNNGVPADRQTDQQTDRQTSLDQKPTQPLILIPTPAPLLLPKQNPIEDAAKILDSLDSLKREIRLKFRKLTDRELLLFSTIYQLDEEKGYADYKSLSYKLGITESSIRDYVGRLLTKGIPLEKIKVNNKTVHLKISPDLKKVASLPTILQLITI